MRNCKHILGSLLNTQSCMFWNSFIFIFHWHSRQESGSVSCDNEQDDLLFSGQHGKLLQSKLMPLKSRESIWKRMKVNKNDGGPVCLQLCPNRRSTGGQKTEGFLVGLTVKFCERFARLFCFRCCCFFVFFYLCSLILLVFAFWCLFSSMVTLWMSMKENSSGLFVDPMNEHERE